MFLIFAILYQVKVRVHTSDGYAVLSSFGFETNGTYDVKFSGFDATNFYCFALLNENAVESATSSGFEYSLPCNEKWPHSLNISLSSDDSFVGIITTKGIYTPYLAVLSPDKSSLAMTITGIFRNPNSFLDFRWNGVLTEKIVVLVVIFVIFTYWIVNWIHHWSVQIWIHYLLTGVFTSILAYNISRYVELFVLNRNDTAHGLDILRLVLRVVAEITFYLTILLIAKGWCIVRDSLAFREFAGALIYTSLFIIFRLLLDYIDNSSATFILLLLSMGSMMLFMRELYLSTNDATLHILAHLVAIANEGINPRTTPIYEKHILYRRFHWTLLGGCCCLLLYMAATIFFTPSFTIDELLTDIIVVVVLIPLCALFRLQGSSNGSYVKISDDAGQHGILLSDLETVNVNSDELNGGRPWEEGMKLPGMPEIVKQPQTNVVLESPDGTDTVSAHVGGESL
jgi:hypothetical protein